MTARGRAGEAESHGRHVILLWIAVWLSAFHGRAAVDLAVQGAASPEPVVTLSNLTYTITVTNVGDAAASNVMITNVLSSRVTYQSVASTRGSCSHTAGIVSCDWGSVANGTGGRITIVARPIAPGLLTNAVSAGSLEPDADPVNNSAAQISTAVNRRRFGSSDFIQIDDVLAAPAVPYPSTINVSGLTAAVYKVTVTLTNVTQAGPQSTGPDDLDILLVSPSGAYVMLLSDGPSSPEIIDATITFDDDAAEYIPDLGQITTGTYKPANYGTQNDIMPSPAPPGPHVRGFTPLSTFNRTDPNGQWRLFVYDDEPEAGGWIDGWGITLLTMETMANLAVSLTDSSDPVLPGETITYISTITNIGPAGSTGVRLTNRVPAGLELLSYSATRGTCTNAGGVISCDIGDLAVAGSEQLTVQVRALNGGTYTNQATVSSDQLDTQPGNNTALQSTTVEHRVELGVEIIASRTPALLEQPLVYLVSVTNRGPDTANSVRLVDELPPGVLLVNASTSQGSCSNQSGIVTCNFGAITNRGRASVLLTCRPTILGPITNLAAVSGNEVDTNPANNLAQNMNSVEANADLVLSMGDSPDPVTIGQVLTYTITLTNRGPSIASNVVVSDVLPPAVRFDSAQATRGACTNDGNSVTCVLTELPPGERVVITFMATALNVATAANTASVTSQLIDPNTLNNAASVVTLIVPAADISIASAIPSAQVWQGGRITYIFTISNHGPSTATGVRLQDTLPAGVSFVSATSLAGGCLFQNGTVNCTFGDLPVGDSLQVTVIGTVAVPPGYITNNAVAIANEQDTNLGNNLVPVVTEVFPSTQSTSDTNTVVLPEIGTAPAYPLTLNVAGMTAAVQRVRVTLQGLSHTYPDDLDMLLVGPSGQSVVLMSDAGGGTAITNLDLTLDDLAASVLPDNTPLSGPHYRPTNYNDDANPEFPAPAPAGAYGSGFDSFTGTDPNGTWSLYIVDDTIKDSGLLRGGWRLDIWARDPMADVGLNVAAVPELVASGSNLVIAVTVSNRGPALATGVMLTNVYSSNLLFSSAAVSQGGCTNEGGLLRCELGSIAPGATALVQMFFVPLVTGPVSNFVSVSAAAVDFNLTDNSASILFTVENPPHILMQPRDQRLPVGSNAVFEVTVAGDPPLSLQWFHNGTAIPGATGTTLAINDVQPSHFGDYYIQVSNRVATVSSVIAVLGPPRPPVIEFIPDQLAQEDMLLTVPLTIYHPDNPLEVLQVSAVCDDTNLVPATNMTFSLDGTNYSLLVLASTNRFGTNIVTVSATDSRGLTNMRSFVLGVESVNDYPYFVEPVGDQTIEEDGFLIVFFQARDVETPVGSLVMAARSYDDVLMPNSVLSWGLFNGNGNVIMTPARNQHGTVLIEIRLRDEAFVRTTNLFTLTVLPVEDPPTISRIDDVTISEDTELNVSFVVDDPETDPVELLISAESSDPYLMPTNTFVFGGTGTSRTLKALPAPNQNGASRITIYVQDAAGMVASNSFLVTVEGENDAPSVSEIPDITTAINQTSVEAAFIVSDLETDPEGLTFTAVSTNTALAPLSGIEFGGNGSNRTVRVTPGAGQTGWTVLQVSVADPDGGVTVREFELFVHETNGPPVIVRQPQDQMLTPGSPLSLRVIAHGPGALRYQWQRDGQDVPGATNDVFAIAAVAGTDRGQYRVRITNDEGSVLSDPARVAVLESTRILSVRRVGPTAEVTFESISKQRYVVEFRDTIDGTWSDLPEIAGTGDVVTVIDPAAPDPMRFYRVRVQ